MPGCRYCHDEPVVNRGLCAHCDEGVERRIRMFERVPTKPKKASRDWAWKGAPPLNQHAG